jgi:beta-1,4-mannosyl-glycoprotein beta-1,4-N-acetylglucosaminyltransferase
VSSVPASPNSSIWPQWLRRLRSIGSRPRLIDAFLFFNEVDILEIRLDELERVVDKFVIVESDHTFAGRPKPYFFEQWRHRFRRWESKIVYRQLSRPGLCYTTDEPARVENEVRQREELGRVVAELGLAPDDIVVISDVDEIWRADCAAGIRQALRHHDVCRLQLRNHRGYINNLSNYAWNGAPSDAPAACRPDILAARGAEGLRPWRQPERSNMSITLLPQAGWHLSSLGGPEAFWIKAQNFSHVVDPGRVIDIPGEEQEIRVLTGPLTQEDCIANQRSYLAHVPYAAQFSPLTYDEFIIEQDVPACMKAHKERYRRFFFFTDCV